MENKDLESKLVRPNCTYEITEREIEVEDEKHPHKVCILSIYNLSLESNDDINHKAMIRGYILIKGNSSNCSKFNLTFLNK